MTDILSVRDPNQPCSHDERTVVIVDDDDTGGFAFWACLLEECPGGREIKLREMVTYGSKGGTFTMENVFVVVTDD